MTRMTVDEEAWVEMDSAVKLVFLFSMTLMAANAAAWALPAVWA